MSNFWFAFIFVCLGIVIGFQLHKMIVAYYLNNVINLLSKHRDISTKEDDSPRTHFPILFTEVNGNSIMLYNRKTKGFVCQANTIEELAQNLLDFKKIDYAMVDHNDEQLLFIEGKVEKATKSSE